jgi:hypothetical protein
VLIKAGQVGNYSLYNKGKNKVFISTILFPDCHVRQRIPIEYPKIDTTLVGKEIKIAALPGISKQSPSFVKHRETGHDYEQVEHHSSFITHHT